MRTRRAARRVLLDQLGSDVWGVVSQYLIKNEIYPLTLNESDGCDAHVRACDNDTLVHITNPRFFGGLYAGAESDRLQQLRDFRTVCRAFRDAVSYANLRQLRIRPNWFPQLPGNFGEMFAGCESIIVNGRDYSKPDLAPQQGTIPSVFRDLPRLREMMFEYFAVIFPPWFRDLALDELALGYRTEILLDVGNRDQFWEDREDVLPPSLRALRHDACHDAIILDHARRLSQLQELEIGAETSPPGWFAADLGQLRRLWSFRCAIAEWAPTLRQMRLESVTFETVIGCERWEMENALEQMVGPGSICGTTIRELGLSGQGLGRVPDSFRPLRLRSINLSQCNLRELPDWLGELPLVVLDVSMNKMLKALPVSLRQATTLRVLYLNFTSLAGPFIFGYENSEKCLFVDGARMIYDEVPDEEIFRRDDELRGISEALPELRLQLHATPDDREDVAHVWWHARCGTDWTDSSFINPRY